MDIKEQWRQESLDELISRERSPLYVSSGGSGCRRAAGPGTSLGGDRSAEPQQGWREVGCPGV